MRPPLTVLLFGPMRVFVGDAPLPKLRSRKAKWLLALLALRGGGPLTRNAVASMLWPDSDAATALTNLRSVVSDLRQALGDSAERLETPDRRTLRLDLTDADVDVLRFEAALAEKRQGDAVRIYTGPLLEDCDEEWAGPERQARERLCLRALRDLAEAAPPQEAIALRQRAVELMPLSDASRRDLMEAFAQAGDLNAALATYREFAQRLRAESGGSPDLQTTDLYVRLRSGDVAKPSPAPNATTPQAPHRITSFVGREGEVVESAKELETWRLVTLLGMGGVGKTRLAQEVSQATKFPDGSAFVALESVHDANGIFQALATALRYKDRLSLPELVASLQSRRLLLVLDNCEHLIGPTARIADAILGGCPGVRILATSREPLGLLGEKIVRVPGLSAPDPRHLPEHPATLLRVLMGYESVRLFVERAEAASGFRLSLDNAGPVAEICAMLEGMPLAIELAACRTRTMSVRDIVGRLADHRLDLLAGNRHTAVPRHQTLRATIDWSFGLLGPEERRLLGRLAVFSGGWTLEAAEEIAGATPELLESLVEKSLVAFSPSGRYGFLESVRQYVAEKGLDRDLYGTHLHWYRNLAERLDSSSAAPEPFESEIGNFRIALDRGEIDVENALGLAAALGIYWRTRRADEEAMFRLRQAIDRPGAERFPALLAKARQFLGMVVSFRDPQAAMALLLSAQEDAARAGDRTREAGILRELALIEYFEGRYDEAIEHYGSSLEIARDLGNLRLVAMNLGGLSLAWMPKGDYERARRLSEESLAAFRRLGNARMTPWALRSLGRLAHDLGDYATMAAVNQEALAMFREANRIEGIAWCLDDLGKAATETGRLALGEDLLEQSLRLMRESTHGSTVADVLQSLGENAIAQGAFERAKAYLEEGLAIYQNSRQRLGIARFEDALGDLELARGRREEAAKHYRSALKTWSDAGDQKRIREGLVRLGDAQDDPVRAHALWAGADHIAARIGLPLPPGLLARHEKTVARWAKEEAQTLRVPTTEAESLALALES